MSILSVTRDQWEFNRSRTLATLDAVAQASDPAAVLGWQPGPGRAPIGWQLLHIGITEELFATERLRGTTPAWPDLVPRFKGGSTPDETAPSVDQIRETLRAARQHLLETFARYTDDDLTTIPDTFRERGWSLGTIAQVLAWHEPHHQGQAHITLNLWKAANR